MTGCVRERACGRRVWPTGSTHPSGFLALPDPVPVWSYSLLFADDVSSRAPSTVRPRRSAGTPHGVPSRAAGMGVVWPNRGPSGWMSWQPRPRRLQQYVSPSKTRAQWQCGGGNAHKHNGQSMNTVLPRQVGNSARSTGQDPDTSLRPCRRISTLATQAAKRHGTELPKSWSALGPSRPPRAQGNPHDPIRRSAASSAVPNHIPNHAPWIVWDRTDRHGDAHRRDIRWRPIRGDFAKRRRGPADHPRGTPATLVATASARRRYLPVGLMLSPRLASSRDHAQSVVTGGGVTAPGGSGVPTAVVVVRKISPFGS